jgi:hypothetical protein
MAVLRTAAVTHALPAPPQAAREKRFTACHLPEFLGVTVTLLQLPVSTVTTRAPGAMAASSIFLCHSVFLGKCATQKRFVLFLVLLVQGGANFNVTECLHNCPIVVTSHIFAEMLLRKWVTLRSGCALLFHFHF